MPRNSVLTETPPLFLHKHSSGCCKPLVNFQSSGEKLILTIFVTVLIVFLWRRGFSGVFTLPSLLMLINIPHTLKWAASVSVKPGVYGVGSIFFLNFCVPHQRCHGPLMVPSALVKLVRRNSCY